MLAVSRLLNNLLTFCKFFITAGIKEDGFSVFESKVVLTIIQVGVIVSEYHYF